MTSLYYLLGLLILPLLAVGSVAALSRWWGRLGGDWLDVATRFSYSLLPLGFGMWLSHYSFHFLGSYETVVPAMQRFVGDLGCANPRRAGVGPCLLSSRGRVAPTPGDRFLGSRSAPLAVHRLSHRSESDTRAIASLKAFLPWGVLIVVLFAAGVWIVLQPMQMRGTIPGA